MLTLTFNALSRCMLCGAASAGQPLCRGCHEDLPRPGPGCRICGLPLPSPGRCGSCAASPPAFHSLIAAFPYCYPVDAIIREFKYRARLHWLRPLAAALAEVAVASAATAPECLLPVPQHWLRRCRRGFNQSLEIARVVGGELGIAVNDGLLIRPRLADLQANLNAADRVRNVRRAFRLRTDSCAGLRAAIVDDVVTTGATVRELARVLKRAGAAEISVWTVARAARL